MALRKCKECGQQISTKAASCPNCGAVLKKKTGCFTWLVAGFFILVIIGVIGSLSNKDSNKSGSTSHSSTPSVSSKDKPQQKLYKEGDTVNIGYTSYAVWRSWWSSRLSDNQFLDQKPDARFLFVELTIRNDDKKARSIAPFRLFDENGAEYEPSSKAWAVEGSIGVLTSLNPSVKKQGFVVFDVPTEHKYKLKVSGGYWSGEDAFVQLSPKASK